MRRTLASPIFAISSNNPSTILAEALSASMRRRDRRTRSEGTWLLQTRRNAARAGVTACVGAMLHMHGLSRRLRPVRDRAARGLPGLGELEHAVIVVAAADDLHADRQAGCRERGVDRNRRLLGEIPRHREGRCARTDAPDRRRASSAPPRRPGSARSARSGSRSCRTAVRRAGATPWLWLKPRIASTPESFAPPSAHLQRVGMDFARAAPPAAARCRPTSARGRTCRAPAGSCATSAARPARRSRPDRRTISPPPRPRPSPPARPGCRRPPRAAGRCACLSGRRRGPSSRCPAPAGSCRRGDPACDSTDIISAVSSTVRVIGPAQRAT